MRVWLPQLISALPADIVFSLTDDQDVALGGWNPMKQTQELLQKSGGLLKNWRIHTPICSPSRSETVSGRYFHNIKSPLPVPPIKLQPAATGHIDGSVYNNQSFAVYLRRDKGYNVGQFGKSNFNTCEGFSRWFQGAFLGYGGGWQDNEAANFSYHGKPTDCTPSTLKESLVRTQPLMCFVGADLHHWTFDDSPHIGCRLEVPMESVARQCRGFDFVAGRGLSRFGSSCILTELIVE